MRVGDILGPVERTPDSVALFLYSAAVWLPHRIHFDLEQARSEGHAGLVIHGPLQGAYLSQMCAKFARTKGATVTTIRFRHLVTAVAGTTLRCGGAVVEVGDREAACELWVERVIDGVRTTEGSARLRLQDGGESPVDEGDVAFG